MNIPEVTTSSLIEAVWYTKNCCPMCKVEKGHDRDGNQVFLFTFVHPHIKEFEDQFKAGKGRVGVADLGMLFDRFNLLFSPYRMWGVL